LDELATDEVTVTDVLGALQRSCPVRRRAALVRIA
jgi:hypothetical protein